MKKEKSIIKLKKEIEEWKKEIKRLQADQLSEHPHRSIFVAADLIKIYQNTIKVLEDKLKVESKKQV